jgi:hypothetical protein
MLKMKSWGCKKAKYNKYSGMSSDKSLLFNRWRRGGLWFGIEHLNAAIRSGVWRMMPFMYSVLRH